ncbi:hsp90 co-chaperone Cdc37 [Anthonomus grandis grandis]|uniref:hsp90 co-chaperone Cdc37 n=1 Tax=Anthonomus grandis grandis TaxID=2921223 RepID=UPI002165E412|nr:hsp90 co-chaperone Cdc37 [Anthonomus grandis grandis]
MVDYSKWKNIEVSDDEDETHPNIDTPSLFRWRHQARMERMEERQKEKEALDKKKLEHEKKLKELNQKLQENKTEELEKQLKQLELEGKKLKEEIEEFQKKEKLTPWNVDTISKPGFAKTIINKLQRPVQENLTEEEKEQRMKQFIKDNEKDLKHFGMLRKYDDSRQFLKAHQQLVCENTANYLVIWCINLEMEDKHELMSHVAHQTICMQYILELAKQLDYDPRACVDAFFSKIQVAEVEYKKSFEDELEQFKERIRRRAAEKIEQAVKELEEEEKQKRLGPGGLDPEEVYNSLPDELKKCFDSRDVKLLQETISKMDEEQAKYHMKRCVDSGLWVPEGGKKGDAEEEESEPVYSEAKSD